MSQTGLLVLQDGREFPGTIFGASQSISGEVVFNTSMVGYPESLTDPSYAGQLLVVTYPLVGNYGVPPGRTDEYDLPTPFEARGIQISGLVVSTISHDVSHSTAAVTLAGWMESEGIPGIAGVDTRALTKHLRVHGSMPGKIICSGNDVDFIDPNQTNLVAQVSYPEPVDYGSDGPRIVLVDTGAKASIVRCLVRAGARVRRVPWDHDFFQEEFDGLFLSNGPGDPKMIPQTVDHVRRALTDKVPTFGICLGNQILALAAGADTYKLKFGHRSQNQPCVEVGTRRCFITSQNHGYAVDGSSLPEGWREWFVNANDQTNEGIRHEWKPARGVQFHPEAMPGPSDTVELFRRFLEMVR